LSSLALHRFRPSGSRERRSGRPLRAGNWPMPGRDPGGTRYSTLTQITPANVRPAEGSVGLPHEAGSPGRWSEPAPVSRMSEDQPLVVGQTMYVATPYSRVVALDSATGREQWVFQIPDQRSGLALAEQPTGRAARALGRQSSSARAAAACIRSAQRDGPGERRFR
jgi:glucose dehydrogenase